MHTSNGSSEPGKRRKANPSGKSLAAKVRNLEKVLKDLKKAAKPATTRKSKARPKATAARRSDPPAPPVEPEIAPAPVLEPAPTASDYEAPEVLVIPHRRQLLACAAAVALNQYPVVCQRWNLTIERVQWVNSVFEGMSGDICFNCGDPRPKTGSCPCLKKVAKMALYADYVNYTNQAQIAELASNPETASNIARHGICEKCRREFRVTVLAVHNEIKRGNIQPGKYSPPTFCRACSNAAVDQGTAARAQRTNRHARGGATLGEVAASHGTPLPATAVEAPQLDKETGKPPGYVEMTMHDPRKAGRGK